MCRLWNEDGIVKVQVICCLRKERALEDMAPNLFPQVGGITGRTLSPPGHTTWLAKQASPAGKNKELAYLLKPLVPCPAPRTVQHTQVTASRPLSGHQKLAPPLQVDQGSQMLLLGPQMLPTVDLTAWSHQRRSQGNPWVSGQAGEMASG